MQAAMATTGKADQEKVGPQPQAQAQAPDEQPEQPDEAALLLQQRQLQAFLQVYLQTTAWQARGGGSRGDAMTEWGYTQSQVEELLCQGVHPWDEDADAVLAVLNGDDEGYGDCYDEEDEEEEEPY
eukprot:TRINITY_DN1202_c0_g1_i1.p2 TRINITY_DN1202_c0_g1~~TRINITY_DN1202_c0_g1_i1.p2  ORF type:complete len:126 (-),score=28.94 TRINITY_DN1202_c0_g1_i1:162-539(-)